MKKHFGWVQEGTALQYVDGTKERSKKMAELLTGVKVPTEIDPTEAAPCDPIEAAPREPTDAASSNPPKPTESPSVVKTTGGGTMIWQKSDPNANISAQSGDLANSVYHINLAGAQNLTLHFH